MNSKDVEKLNKNIVENLKCIKKIKNEEQNQNLEHKKEIKKNECDKCCLEFNDNSKLEKHKWKHHPMDEYQYYHSQINDWSNYSLAYRDDPYY